MATYYIQRKSGKDLETVGEVTSWKEAKQLVAEYRISDTSANYYVSSRACKHWKK